MTAPDQFVAVAHVLVVFVVVVCLLFVVIVPASRPVS